MTFTQSIYNRTRAVIAALVAVALLAAFTFAVPEAAQARPTKAHHITRARVLKRAKAWVRKRIPYSQSRYHQGYRQDCSGFVSMAWQLGNSYTTRSLPSVSRRISASSARPGDAVLKPGHVVIFGAWKNKRARTFYAFEEPSSGKVARKRVMSMTSSSKVLRRPGIVTVKKHKKTPRKVSHLLPQGIPTISSPAPSLLGTATVSRVASGGTASLAIAN